VTCDLGDHAADRRAAALVLHALRADELGRRSVLADTLDCEHCATGVLDVLAATLLGALRGYADDVDLEDTLARVVARAALAEAEASMP
jgi:hypothetical protein